MDRAAWKPYHAGGALLVLLAIVSVLAPEHALEAGSRTWQPVLTELLTSSPDPLPPVTPDPAQTPTGRASDPMVVTILYTLAIPEKAHLRMLRPFPKVGPGCATLLAPPLPVPTCTATEVPLPDAAWIEGVPVRKQLRNLSCESQTATILAAYWGILLEEAQFFAALPKADNPYTGFVGDVDAPPGSLPPVGYGVYAQPVADTLRRFGLDAQARRHMGIQSLKAELAAERPVIVWATYEMWLYPSQFLDSPDGNLFEATPYEHTFVAIGYDEDGLYLIDVWDAQVKHYSYAAFAASWRRFSEMAVTARGTLPTCPADACRSKALSRIAE